MLVRPSREDGLGPFDVIVQTHIGYPNICMNVSPAKKQQRVRHYAHRLRHYSSGRSLAPTRETFFSMRRAVSLELTSCVCHRKKLTVIKSRLKHSYFVGLIFIVCDSWKAPMFSICNRRTTNAQSDDDDDDDRSFN